MRVTTRPALLVATLSIMCPALAGPTFTWERVADMPIGKGGQISGIVDGKVILAGGTHWTDDTHKVWSAETYIYDPSADVWTEGPPVPFPVSYGAGQAIGRKLYVVSGSDGTRDYSLTMVLTKIGKKLHWVWGPAVPEPRIYPASVVIGSKLYVIGGAPDHDLKGKLYDDILILDTARPEEGWRRSRGMPGTGRTLSAAAAIGDRIYVFGGYRQVRDGLENSDDAFVYDTKADRWTRLPDVPYAARAWDGLALDGKAYILGGYVTWPRDLGRPDGFTDNILRFDPVTNTYSDAGDLPLPNVSMNPRVLRDGRVFVAGGEDKMKHRTEVTAIGVLK